jgi:hypothetical protein
MKRGFLLPASEQSSSHSAKTSIQKVKAVVDLHSGDVLSSPDLKVDYLQDDSQDFKMTHVKSSTPGGSFNVLIQDGAVYFLSGDDDKKKFTSK